MMEVPDDGRESTGDERTARSRGKGLAVEGVRGQPRGAQLATRSVGPGRPAGAVFFSAIGHEQYLFSAIFGVVFTTLADPGGSYGSRAWRIAVFWLIGAALTALGFGIGGDAWGWLVLAAFAVTLVAGLAVTFGVRRFVTAMLLNLWFIIALGAASSLHHQA